jgi:AraC-like DNA-binding protein
VVAEAASCRPENAVRLGAVTVDLITAFLAHHAAAEDAVSPESRQQALMVGIRSFVERNLGDAQLSPAAVAAAHHISVRYPHRLFQQQGATVSSWIRHRRLERCRRDLAEPALSLRPIHAVAFGGVSGMRRTSVKPSAPPTACRPVTTGKPLCEPDSALSVNGSARIRNDTPAALGQAWARPRIPMRARAGTWWSFGAASRR